ncbi:MAG: hypothetical protein JST00_39390 [Deltaproteobacteria bacterium]|nr:hypothetical protein [Deltaproteobacteria bacterium]
MLDGTASRIAVFVGLTFVAFATAVACGASDGTASFEATSSSGAAPPDGTADAGFGPSTETGADAVDVNGIVLVHAASFPAVRLCFDGTPDEQPIPAADLMPASNIPGLEMGTALRIAPRRGALGRAVAYREETIRALYFNSPQSGPSCERLRKSAAIASVEVATNLADLSSGVHLLVLQGCAGSADDPSASVARCGFGWKAATGNLSLTHLPLQAFKRPSASEIPVQIVQLSHDLDVRAKQRVIGIGIGPLEAGAPFPFAEGVLPFGEAVPSPPALMSTKGIELADFATTGVFVSLGAPLDDGGMPVDAGDAGPRETLFAQSLADIQRRSSPRSLPPDWFASASSYVLLSVGELDPKEPDGGPGDERRALHLLAVPLSVAGGGSPPVPGDDGGLVSDADTPD